MSLVTQTVVDPSTVPLAPAPEKPAPSPRIPDYRLIKHIGAGAFGDVWLAEEKHIPGVFRAVKILRTSHSAGSKYNASGNSAVSRELQGLQLYETRARGHAHLVQVLHVGRIEHNNGDDGGAGNTGAGGGDGNGGAGCAGGNGIGDGCIYYAMEIADHAGGAQPFTPEDYRPLTLKSLLHYGGRLPPERAIEYQMQLLDGLDHLHRHGLQHRDVKPGNLLFVRGQLKLADLGLTSSDDTRQSCGTLGYLPPESKEPDDLYAAGIVLYEMVTGQPASSFPDWPDDLDPGADARLAELRTVFSKACDRDPNRRFADAQSFKTAMAGVAAAFVSPNSEHKRAANRARLAIFASVFVALASVVAAGWLGYRLWGAMYGVFNGRHPYNGSPAKVYSDDQPYQFEWAVLGARNLVPTNNDERRVELFDLEAKLNGPELLLGGGLRSWSIGNPIPRCVDKATGKHGEIVQVFLVLETDEVNQLAAEVANLARDPAKQYGEAAREKNFDTRFREEIQMLLGAQLPAEPGNINDFMLGIDLATLNLSPNKSYPILLFVTAAEYHGMYQELATRIADDAGLRIGSVQYTPNPD